MERRIPPSGRPRKERTLPPRARQDASLASLLRTGVAVTLDDGNNGLTTMVSGPVHPKRDVGICVVTRTKRVTTDAGGGLITWPPFTTCYANSPAQLVLVNAFQDWDGSAGRWQL